LLLALFPAPAEAFAFFMDTFVVVETVTPVEVELAVLYGGPAAAVED